MTGVTSYCYCETMAQDLGMLQCTLCKNYFHSDCLKHGRPSSLEGDVFFHLTCANCGPDERCQRMKLQWMQVVALALYNLQLQGGGKCGFFRWKEHICAFIAKHWTVFFGHDRRKTQTWFGTVAGTLSGGCPQFFKSGTHILKENGWWALLHNRPPSLDMLTSVKNARRQSLEADSRHLVHSTVLEGLRKRDAKTTLQSAIELRAKRDTIQKCPGVKNVASEKSKQGSPFGSLPQATSSSTVVDVPVTSSELEVSSDATVTSPDTLMTSPGLSTSAVDSASYMEGDISHMSWHSEHSCSSSHSTSHGRLSHTDDLVVNEELPEFLLKGDEDEVSDLEIDPCAMSPALDSPMDASVENCLPTMSNILDSMQESSSAEPEAGKLPPSPSQQTEPTPTTVQVKTEPPELPVTTADEQETFGYTVTPEPPGGGCHSDSESEAEESATVVGSIVSRKRKFQAVVKEEPQEPAKPRVVAMSLHEEKLLLKTLESLRSVSDATARRLHAKLRLRQVKRQRGLPVFDLDSLVSKTPHRQVINQPASQMTGGGRHRTGDYCILDRYQMGSGRSGLSQSSVSFMNRLVGTEDDQLQAIRSPYTSRMLKAFIRRDYECRPLKMRLLADIQAYPHRSDKTWVPEQPPSIDYCYVRPQHIPSINSLCREFFWPTIDVSECLQYPDFSCVVLYRKFVIGFAFMVPDVKYNEAYISFLFTHPEWRGAGIATFMIYHLLQTCMGKDVTLHVSANNPAMMLYQQFGFKVQQLILDFYEKYFPEESTQCRHAFFLRLSR